jgi:ABC-2 type transport system permease protein
VIRTIIRAQWLSIRNVRGTAWTGRILTIITSLLWYGLWISMAYAAYQFTVEPNARATVQLALPRGMLFVIGYWQFTPLLVASLGAALDLKKLLVYPIPPSRLFWVEVLLRLSTGVEMLILLAGSFLGLVLNPKYGGFLAILRALPPFTVFVLANLFMAAGVRNLLERLLGRKHIRELFVVVAVMAAAVPQLLVLSGVSGAGVREWFTQEPWRFLPSTAASRLALDGPSAVDWIVLLAWTSATFFFGRWQFQESEIRCAGGAVRYGKHHVQRIRRSYDAPAGPNTPGPTKCHRGEGTANAVPDAEIPPGFHHGLHVRNSGMVAGDTGRVAR